MPGGCIRYIMLIVYFLPMIFFSRLSKECHFVCRNLESFRVETVGMDYKTVRSSGCRHTSMCCLRMREGGISSSMRKSYFDYESEASSADSSALSLVSHWYPLAAADGLIK
jgi:hypothetical protein